MTGNPKGLEINWHYFGKRLHAVEGTFTERPYSVCGMWADGWSEEPFNDDRHYVARCKKCLKKLGLEILR